MPYEEITEEQFNTMISKIVKKETLENIPGQRIENPDKYCESCNDN